MADVKKDINEKDSYLEMLKCTQKKMPSLVLPSMGLLKNEVTVKINGKDFIKKNNQGG